MKKYSRSSKAITGKLHDEIVMMDIEKGKYFSLNRVATSIWEHLEIPRSLDELCGLLIEEHEVGTEQCLAETGELLKELVEMGLLTEQEN
jgi:hypothetical protein